MLHIRATKYFLSKSSKSHYFYFQNTFFFITETPRQSKICGETSKNVDATETKVNSRAKFPDMHKSTNFLLNSQFFFVETGPINMNTVHVLNYGRDQKVNFLQNANTLQRGCKGSLCRTVGVVPLITKFQLQQWTQVHLLNQGL